MRYAFFIFITLLLFVYTDRIVEPYLVPRALFWALGVGAMCLFFLYKKQAMPVLSDSTNISIGAFFGLTAWSWLSLLWAHDWTLVLPTAIQYSLMAFTFWGLCVARHEKMLSANDVIAVNLIFASIAVAFLGYSVAQGFYLQKSISVISDHIGFLFGNKNLAASFLYLVLPFLVVFIIKNNENDKNTVDIATKKDVFIKNTAVALLIFGIITIIWFTQCRSVWIGLVLSGIFILIGLFLQKIQKKALILSSLFAIIGILCVITWLNLDNLTWLTNINTVNTRVEVWKNTLLMIRENPILGVGAGNWQIFFPKYGLATLGGATETGRLVFQRPHNDFLWIWSELGFVGIACYGLLFVTLLAAGISAVRHSLSAMVYTAFLFGYIGVAFADFPLERIEHQIVFCLLAIEILWLSEPYIKLKPAIRNSKLYHSYIVFLLKKVTISGVFIAFFSVFILVFRYNSEICMRRVYAAHEVGDWQSIAKDVQKAQNPFYHFDPMTTPLAWYAGLARAGQGDFAGAQQQFEIAAMQHPFHINTLNNLGSAHQVQGNIPKAIEFYEKALACSPHFDETLLNLSATYLLNKNRKKAEFYFAQCRIDTTQGSRYRMLSDSLGR
jgi:O-antigen ligase